MVCELAPKYSIFVCLFGFLLQKIFVFIYQGLSTGLASGLIYYDIKFGTRHYQNWPRNVIKIKHQNIIGLLSASKCFLDHVL